MARKSRSSKRSVSDLPQSPETWYCADRLMRAWLSGEDEQPVRPHILLVINLADAFILGFEIFPYGFTPDQVRDLLFKIMLKPLKPLRLKPHRPEEIVFENPALVSALEPALAENGIRAKQGRVEEVDDILKEMEAHLQGDEPEIPGLLSQKGVTPELVADLFAAAAGFYRAEPWVQLSTEHILAITIPPERKPRYVQVLGEGGIEYGLAIYRRWEDLERMYQPADSPLENLPPGGAHSLLFDEITDVPFDDLDDVEKFGWEVIDDQSIPVPMIFTPEGEAKRPGKSDLLWYEAALRAIPVFIKDHMQPTGPEEFAPVKASVPVQTHRGRTEVTLEYPGGTLPKETRPVDLGDWPDDWDDEGDEGGLTPPVDRRAMEGMMRLFGGEAGDPDLAKAQDVMYDAWEQSNPARRIQLARKALSISPDCADAYVLLAEEEAGSLAQALEYYEKGVEAGERALGKAYFAENAGYFWGLLETRPYMRARHGLAETLWELGKPEAALEHFQEMLRLNPQDNQGIRYRLASLLLQLDKRDDLEKLLKQYQDDAFSAWVYTRALLYFRQAGASAKSNRALEKALKQNPYVPAYLAGLKRIPNRMPEYIGFGDENEAIDYAAEHLKYWRQTPGAIDWLRSKAPGEDARRKSSGK